MRPSNGMTRWLLLTEFFPPEHGGIQAALATLAQPFQAELTVVTRPQPGDQAWDQAQHYSVIRRSLWSGRTKPSWWWLIAWLWSRRGLDELTVFGHFSPAVTAAWLLSWFGYRYAVLVHGQDLLSEERRGFRRWLVGPLLRRARWIGVNSAFTASAVHRHKVVWSKIVRTHPAVDDQLLDNPAQPIGQQLVTVCRLVARKNVAMVIRAVAELRRDWPQLEYHIIGDGPERASLERLAVELGITAAVTFHGQVQASEKQARLRQASLAVMVPKVLQQGSDVEGLGIFYLEAAAVGLPIVASPTGGVGEAVIDGRTGRLVNPDSLEELVAAMRKLLSDPDRARAFGRAGRDFIRQEFTATVRNRRFAWMLAPLDQVPLPKVSIVIPVYNHAGTVGRTLQSVAAQTWPKVETIVVNDGSTDDLESALVPWRPDITYLTQPNQGAPVARNLGAQRASGEYLLFLDADTWLHPELLTRLVQTLATHPEASWAYSNFRFGPKGFRLQEFSAPALRRLNYIHTSSLLRRRDFPGFDPSLTRFQDWDLWLTLSSQGRVGTWLPEELFRVSQTQGGMKASQWMPRFVYRLPLIGTGRGSQTIRSYRQAEQVIRKKHGLA